MEKLLAYINNCTAVQREALATSCETSINYLRKAISTRQLLGPVLCVLIERATGGQVTRKDLRPDDWQDIWPELAQPTTQEATHD